MGKSGKQLRSLVAAGILLFLPACSILPKEEQLPEAPVLQKNDGSAYEIVEAVRGDLVLKQSILCQYQAKEEVRAGFTEKNMIAKKIYVTVGQQVKEGELLAEADNEEIEENIAEQRWELKKEQMQQRHLEEEVALLKQKKDFLEQAVRSDETFRDDLLEVQEKIGQQEQAVQMQQEKVQIMTDRLAELNSQYRTTQLRADISGIVTSVNTDETAGGWICEISDFSEAYFRAETEEALALDKEEQVAVTGVEKPYQTTVISCEEKGNGKYEVLLKLNEPDLSLRSGRSGYIERITEEYKGVLYLPQAVIQKSDDMYFVYYLDEKEIRRRKTVTVGDTINGMTVILDGVEEGEQVIR